MTTPILGLFKEQLENESAAIARRYDLNERGDHLIWWYFKRLEEITDTQIGEIVCDGGGDLGIDAIWIDESNVAHFFTFKNPKEIERPFPAGEVDKTLSGLNIVLARRHESIANSDLRERVEEIYQTVPSGYVLHLVTSGNGIPEEAKQKLDSFVENLAGPSEEFFRWQLDDLPRLQDRFYRRNLPTVEEPIAFKIDFPPYQVRSANHDSYMFHASGKILAELYRTYGEQLLQQNIRVSQGDSATNALIRATATTEDSDNFIHYNNGITFLCESAQWDGFTRLLTLLKAQVVNGGQTIRVLSRTAKDEKLRGDVGVPVRVITSQGDKDFSSNVAVNLNNQNTVDPSFLRSNEPRIIQLANALESTGWYLERREREINTFTEQEQLAIEAKIGHKLEQRTIKLKEGAQAYVATFMRQPELAKKNPKRIFAGANEGGYFDRVFNTELTAERFLIANAIGQAVSGYVRKFMYLKRRADRADDWHREYTELLGDELMSRHVDMVNQVVPQSALFLAALAYDYRVVTQKRLAASLVEELDAGHELLNELLAHLIDVAKSDRSLSKSWPTLLKSQSFFEKVASYLKGRASTTSAPT